MSTNPLNPSNRACKNTCKSYALGDRASYTIDPSTIVTLQQEIIALQKTVAALETKISGSVEPGTCEGEIPRYDGTTYAPDGTTNLNIGCGTTKAGASAYSIQIGFSPIIQADMSTAIGYRAGASGQGLQCVAIGDYAGEGGQAFWNVAIGSDAGKGGQGARSIAIGRATAQTGQGVSCVTIGPNAGQYTQGNQCTALGSNAGQDTQGDAATAVGHQSGNETQGTESTACGGRAGQFRQATRCVALGYYAGRYDQGANSVCIGYSAGYDSQASNSIVINGTGAILGSLVSNTLTVKPIRNAGVTPGTAAGIPPEGGLILAWNSTTGEIFAYSGS